jgi:hypothetical protein
MNGWRNSVANVENEKRGEKRNMKRRNRQHMNMNRHGDLTQ